MNALVPAAAAAGLLFLLVGKSKAATPPRPPVIVPSPQGAGTVAERMAKVLATGDPATIRFEAGRLRQEGYTAQAGELERAAAAIEAERVRPPLTPPAPPVVITTPPIVVSPPLTPPLPPVVITTPSVPSGPVVLPPPPAPLPSYPGVPAALRGVTLKRMPGDPFDARVIPWQDRMVALGVRVATHSDGYFGSKTEKETKALQKKLGLPQTGIADPTTINAAFAAPTVVPPPVVVPTPVLPAGPAPSGAGKAPTITASLKSLPALLRNGKPTFKAPASSGTAVKDWQQVLFDLGFLKSQPSGKFDDSTEVATRAFQAAANSAAAKSGKPKLDVDGVVGPATVRRAAEARIMPGAPAAFTGDFFGDDSGVWLAPSVPRADTPLPGVIPPMAPQPPAPDRALAARLVHMLLSAPRGAEDRTLVARFQSENGLRATGYYGPSVAIVLAQRFGIIPPKPFYWTESRTGKSKSNYRDALRLIGERDPQRVEEWIRAGNV